MLKAFRNAFFSGLILLTPVSVTIFVMNFLVNKVGQPASQYFFFYLPKETTNNPWFNWGLAFVSMFIVFLLITILGWSSKLLIGKLVLRIFERMIHTLPFVRNVYLTVKQIIDTFSEQNKAVFQKAVLIEYPRKGIYVLGFLTSNTKGEIQYRTENKLLNIFVPTTPNPTSGFLLMVPENEVTYLNMSITDSMKLIISGGAVVPTYNPQTGESVSAEIKTPQEKHNSTNELPTG